MSTGRPAPFSWRFDIRDGLPTVTLKGTLTASTGEMLYDALVGRLRQRRAALLIDVSAVTAGEPAAVVVFDKIMVQAIRWPDVLVTICSPYAKVRSLLHDGVVDPRVVFGTVTAARTAVLARVPPVTEDFLPVSGSARRARDVVTDACLRWDEPRLVDSAVLVVSELITNAAVHAHTMMTLQVRLRLCHLHIAVFDGCTTHAMTRQTGPSSSGGRGLHLVDAVSAAWGSTALPTGKVVWSALSRPTA